MHALVVIANPADWPGEFPGASVIAARAYLGDRQWGAERGVRVVNLCESLRYQSLGYYVSLLAEARGHKPLPRVSTIEDLKSQNLVRLITANLDAEIDRALAPIKSERFELSIYFGRNLAHRHDALARLLFDALQAPLLRAEFERRDGHWHIRSLRPLALSDVPPAHRDFMTEAASAFLSGRLRRLRKTGDARFEIAILHDPANTEPPSNPRAIQKFIDAGEAIGLRAVLITRNDYARLTDFDALFIRDTTNVNHYTYRFARRALAEGMVVIDEPDSILKCNNKVFLAELLARHDIPTPKTLLIHRDNIGDILKTLRLPCVLKQPDSAFSLGVVKAETEAELDRLLRKLLARSELVIAQEWLPTEYDWRIGVLDRRALFVARYYMVPGHWQIVQHQSENTWREGATEAVALSEAPQDVVALGVRAANLIGDGFYGVDIKRTRGRAVVIEVNDNPNVDAGNEDGVLRDALYREVMGTFMRRLEARAARNLAGRRQ